MAKRFFQFCALMAVLNGLVAQKNREITEPDMIRNKYLKLEKTLWEMTLNSPYKAQNEKLKQIFIDHNSFVNTYMLDSIDIDDLKQMIETNGWHQLKSDIVNVHRFFVSFRHHVARETRNSNKESFNEEATLDLSMHILNDAHWPLQTSLDNLFKVTLKDKLYYSDISSKFNCHFQRSVQQILYQLYNVLTIVETEAYMMLQWAQMVRTVYHKGNASIASRILRNEIENTILLLLQTTAEIFDKAERVVWRCDPEIHSENSTFLQITRLLQGHIENEKDLNRERSCDQTCHSFQFTENFGCSERSICRRQSGCKGKILNCFTTKDNMWICPSSKGSSRRYEYIVYEDGTSLGEPAHCETNGFHVEQYWFWRVIWNCDHCFCICDEDSKKSDRYFSLKEAVSDIKNNRVVTGLRFVKSNRMIHLQIQESKLLGYGKVDQSTTQWAPISTFTILDKGVKVGTDYHLLQFEKREIDLDDLTAPVDHIVTGVRLRVLGHHLNLEMRVSEISFSTGQLDTEKSFWVSNDNTENSKPALKRTEFLLKWPDVPTKTRLPSKPLSKSNTFVKFTHSDIDKDAAQTTVPFIDSQGVTTVPAMPLQGVGLFVKAQTGYGGFITPKIYTINYSSFIMSNMANIKSGNDL